MTQEEKARAYDEALERARKQRDEYQEELDKTDKNSKLASILRAAISAVELVFPELVESEDEKNWKAVMEYVKDDALRSWLEKQKENIEKEYVFRPLAGTDITIAAEQAIRKAKEGDYLVLAFNGFYTPVTKHDSVKRIVDEYDSFIEKPKEQSEEPKIAFGDWEDKEKKEAIITCLKYMRFVKKITNQECDALTKWIDNNLVYNQEKEWDLKQKEQKPAIKLVFPKFPVGDIIRNVHDESDKTTRRISYVGEHGYNFDYRHLGDKAGGGSFGFCYEDYYELVEQKPAENHDLLAQLREHLANTPKEQLDAEWKELEEWNHVGPTVEEYFHRIKPAEWSEEDEILRVRTINRLETLNFHGISGKEIRESIDWLKSLPERFNPQPNIEICPHSIKSKSYKEKPADEQFPPLEGLDAIKAKYYDDGFKNGFDEGVESVKPAEWDDYTKTNLGRAIQIIKDARGTLHGYQTDDGIYECDKAIEALEHFLYSGLEIEKSAEWSEKYIADIFEKVGLSKIVREQGNDGLTNALQAAMIELSKVRNTEWSEEDETRLTNILIMLKEYVIHHYSKDDVYKSVDWLENRVKFLRPQPKQEWSEEEKEILDSILSHYVLIDKPIDANGIPKEKYISLIKSIRFDTYKNCNSHWKPSEEQMEALLNTLHPDDPYYCELRSLYEQLKKLGVKEEPEYYQHFDPDC